MSFNFLKQFVRLLEKTEVPPRFQIWCGISALLAVLERRVWLPQGIYNVYPNYYIVLIAASGQKKSTPINVVEKLLRRVDGGPTIVAQKVTPEALITAIKATKVTDAKHLIQDKCGGIVIADELATFLDRNALDHGLGPVLTTLFDCKDFEYSTIKRGIEQIKGGYLSILGGTTVELLRNALPKDAIGGGFTSRTLFIYEDKIAPPVPWVDYDEELITLEQELVDYLSRLTTLSGSVILDPEAREFFEADYRERYANSDFRRNAALQGYENRRHMHLFKVAMALMVSESPQLKMSPIHLRGAKFILEEAEEQMPTVMDLIVSSDTGAQGNMILQFIIKMGGTVTRTELVRQFGNRMDAMEISKSIDTLRTARRIDLDTSAGKIVYKLVKGEDNGRIR